MAQTSHQRMPPTERRVSEWDTVLLMSLQRPLSSPCCCDHTGQWTSLLNEKGKHECGAGETRGALGGDSRDQAFSQLQETPSEEGTCLAISRALKTHPVGWVSFTGKHPTVTPA